ncbi:MAG: HINT domain-containing protein [Christensenellaceae bacterium]|jgi:hypothetical protein|nr:HINT domain-containing protein [Christensenellaceae bacterium]
MEYSLIKTKKRSCQHLELFLIVFALILLVGMFFCTDYGTVSYAAVDNLSESTSSSRSAIIPVQSYVLSDNTGYYIDSSKKVANEAHPLLNNYIDLSIVANADNSVANIETSIIDGINGYGIIGSGASIELKYNFDKTNDIEGRFELGEKRKFSISNDTYQSVGDFQDIGVIGMGAMLIQKSTDGKNWVWQTKDGESKKVLKTVDFLNTVKPSEYNDTGEKSYTLYTPSGIDLLNGIYIKITFAYEVEWINIRTSNRNTYSEIYYYNIIEQATIYLTENSGELLFHNVSNFDRIGEEDSSGAITINNFETIKSGDCTLNGFRLDTMGVDSYKVSYKYNGIDYGTATNGQYFLYSGRYDFVVNRRIGDPRYYTIFIDRREVNDAATGYFGSGLFTEDSQRIYSTGEYPVYVAGSATWNLNATNGTILPLAGRLFKITEDADGISEVLVENIKRTFSIDIDDRDCYKTSGLQGTLTDPGIYKFEFWSNPRYEDNTEVTGDIYHFVFRFEIVSADTNTDPSINEAYLNGLGGFSDLQSKYYGVSLKTQGTARAIFAFAYYDNAYDFAYNIEREKVELIDGKYVYNRIQYTTQYEVLTAIDLTVTSLVIVGYFDATNPESYQSADIFDKDILLMNFNRDFIVFLNDEEHELMKSGLPSLNGRRYRYVVEDTGQIEEGILSFAFIKIDSFESDSIVLKNKETGVEYEIIYGVSVEYQLRLANAPSGIYITTETNIFGDCSEYETVYIKSSDMTGIAKFEIYRNNEITEKTVTQFDLAAIYAHGFILKSIENELDPESIVKIRHNDELTILTFREAVDVWFSDAGVYNFQLIDRQGNNFSFEIIIDEAIGFADIYLELEYPDDELITHYRAFVGQEIDLPTTCVIDELYVFDGWLYDDELITNAKFTPKFSGAIYIWQQLTRRYTYLDFDSNGGDYVNRIIAELGVEINLPTSYKESWVFGGWKLDDKIYKTAYIPDMDGRVFVAVWDYLETIIELYDGNIYEVIEAHSGEKVLLPFPTRTGYKLFGWYQAIDENIAKIYYGQITQFGNFVYMRLDAIWTRNNDINLDNLEDGSIGKTRIHFVDEGLILSDVEGYAGETKHTPVVSRGGFTFVGWVWKTSTLAGKIFTGNTVIIPENAGEKILLEAAWIAKPVSTQTQNTTSGAGTLSHNDSDGLINKSVLSRNNELLIILMSVVLYFVLLLHLLFTKKKRSLLNLNYKLNNTIKNKKDTEPSIISYCHKITFHKVSPFLNIIKKIGFLSVVLIIILAVVLTFESAFSTYNENTFDLLINNEMPTLEIQTENNEVKKPFEFDYIKYEDEKTVQNNELIAEFKSQISMSTFEATGDEFNLSDDEIFLYTLIMLDLYSMGYEAFASKAVLSDEEGILGIGYTDFSGAYESVDETDTLYIGAGFIAFPGQTEITESNIESGVIIYGGYQLEAEDEGESSYNKYILSYLESYSPCHYVANGKYIVYNVNNTEVEYTSVDASQHVYNIEYGTVYSYDVGRIIFDPNLGQDYKFTATSINTLLDPAIARGEYERYITEQTANGFTVDTLNFVYISYSALDAYYISQQNESLLGIDVREFYEMEKTIGSNEYYTVDENGNLTKLNFPPQESENKADWLDRLAGAALAIGTICAGIIIVAAVSVVSCGTASAIAPYVMGAFIGAGMEIFMQTVVQGKKLEDINWLRVGIAAVSGVLSAIPGVGWLGAGLIQGGTEAAMTWADGGNIQDILKAFTVGFITGVVIHGLGKALNKIKFCFVAGTGILMSGGYIKVIENVRVGDYVKSFNEDTRQIEDKRVTQLFVNETDELTIVNTSNGERIVSTPDHKFLSNGHWISAEDLRAGDVLRSVNGQIVIVESIQHELLEKPIKIYNFEVQDNHTYFVGINCGIAVHNKCKNDVVGSYEFRVKMEDGNEALYIGKGPETRMKQSMRQKDKLGEIIEGSDKFYPASSNNEAFIEEAKKMNIAANDDKKLLNKILSPGFKIGKIEIDIKKLKKILFSKGWHL